MAKVNTETTQGQNGSGLPLVSQACLEFMFSFIGNNGTTPARLQTHYLLYAVPLPLPWATMCHKMR